MLKRTIQFHDLNTGTGTPGTHAVRQRSVLPWLPARRRSIDGNSQVTPTDFWLCGRSAAHSLNLLMFTTIKSTVPYVRMDAQHDLCPYCARAPATRMHWARSARCGYKRRKQSVEWLDNEGAQQKAEDSSKKDPFFEDVMHARHGV